jgi:uncharacterized membrane protein YhaH (DUF805 family)
MAGRARVHNRYRDGWMLVTAVTASVGVWAALWTWPVVAVLGAFVFTAAVSGSVAEAALRESGRRRMRRVGAVGGLAGAAAVSAMGLIALLGSPGLLLLGVLATTCPHLWMAVRRWRASRAPGPARGRHMPKEAPETGARTVPTVLGNGSESPLEVPSEPRLLDDYALCSAWRRSYIVLERPHSPETQLRVVQQRQQYLDELERRNPTGLAAWLASGARAAGDPTRFIVRKAQSS